VIGIGATLNERFTLEKQLGQGGMGTVYRATDQVLGRSVAIKFLKELGSEQDADKIRLEAQILARLVHDNIVRLYDFAESEGSCFLVMEEVNGSSFAQRWQALPLHDRLRICGEVAEALDYAHFQGVIHRDVKPGNVLLTAADDAKLSDFGLSLFSCDRSDQSGTIRGTPYYMSPEQAQGKSLDHRTDLYSVGVMLYECATGDVPFKGDMLSLIGQHVHAAPPAPRVKNPEIWSTLDSLILSLLEKNRTKRPASGSLVALALFEEAERARRLEQINPGIKRSNLLCPTPSDRPPSSTLTVGGPRVEPTPLNGTSHTGPLSRVSSASAVNASALPRMSDLTQSPSSPAGAALRPARNSREAAVGSCSHPVAREMLAQILATPVVISPRERYLYGHYLAFLLGGSRRQGMFLRRPLDATNSDRARLLLSMTWLSSLEPTDEEIERAGALLDDRPDVRAALSPIVVMKYLAGRDTFGKCKRFRRIRKRLLDASAYACKAMLDANGVLNPGMMPRTLDDLELVAPARDALDAQRVSLWNRVTDLWRDEDEFRDALLRYATRCEHLEAVSTDLWPEVVCPLVERARRQRRYRPRHEALWDFVIGKLLRIPVPGVRLDRVMIVAIPLEVAEELDLDLSTFVDDPTIDEDDASPSTEVASSETQAPRTRRPIYVGGKLPREEAPIDDDAPPVKITVPLCPPDPFLFTQNVLRNLWEAAIEAMEGQNDSRHPVLLHRSFPIGPYELAVVPIGRGRSAVRVVLKGMQQGKQIEIFTPAAGARDAATRAAIAIWIFEDTSMAVAYQDVHHKERFILWHAPKAHQFNFDHVEELKRLLSSSSLEVPTQLDQIASGK
jgi:serine/threonine-protein kinase